MAAFLVAFALPCSRHSTSLPSMWLWLRQVRTLAPNQLNSDPVQIGLVTPPGLLGDFVARAVEPAGHRLIVAPDFTALFGLQEQPSDVVLVAPLVAGKPAEGALEEAQATGL